MKQQAAGIHIVKNEKAAKEGGIKMLLKYKDIITTLDPLQKERITKALKAAGIQFWTNDEDPVDLGIIKTSEENEEESAALTTFSVRKEDAKKAVQVIDQLFQ